MIKQILLVIIISIILKLFKNNSNFKQENIIPVISTLLVKYLWGDFDNGYIYTTSDISFWIILPVSSFITIKVLDKLIFF